MADHSALVGVVVGAVEADQPAGVAAALAGVGEAERRAVWKVLKGRATFTAAGAIAGLGCAPGAKSAAEAAWVPFDDPSSSSIGVEVLTSRRPPWLEDLALRLVARESGTSWGFAVVHGLVRTGAISEPTDPSYFLAMVHGLAPYTNRTGATPLDALRTDPAALDGALWTVLATERAGRTLASSDGWRRMGMHLPGREPPEPQPEATWHHALVTLAGEGAVPRDRLLDATLHAMLADWAAVDVAWFVELHDGLAPTSDELAARAPTYLRLLASEIGTVVQLGLRAAGTLLDVGAVEAAALVAALEPAALRPQKGTATAALKLLAHCVERDPASQGAATDVARLGLDHPRADVRDQARELVARWRVGGGSEAPEPVLPMPLEDAPPEVPAPEPVTPVADADELAELLAHLIEEADDPVAVERALDGVLRFAGRAPATAESLARRADERVTELYPEPWSGREIRSDLAALVLVWLGRRQPGLGYEGRVSDRAWEDRWAKDAGVAGRPAWSLAALVSRRIHEVATAISSGTGCLLSMPSTSDGVVAASALNVRLREVRAAWPLDLELALLRVPPGERSELRIPLVLRGRMTATHVLGLLTGHRPEWQRVVGPTTVWWRPQQTTMVTWADPGSPAAAAEHLVATVLDRRAPLAWAGPDAHEGDFVARPEQVTATWPLMLPHHFDHLAAHVHPRLARALEKARSGAAPVLEAIGRSPHRGTAPTSSAIALGLAAKDPAVRTAVIDAFIIRAARGLVDAAALGEQLRLCLADDVVVGSRVVDSLGEAARAGRHSAAVVLEVLAGVLAVTPGRRDAHRWVELVADLTIELDRPAALPQPFRELAAGADRSVLARACRRVRVLD